MAGPLDRLPHAHPFRLLDRVLELDASGGTGLKCVTSGEALSPGLPEMPGVLVVEALAQLSGLVMRYASSEGGAMLAEIRTMRFARPARPGETLRLAAALEASFGALASFEVKAHSGGELIAEGSIVLASTPGRT